MTRSDDDQILDEAAEARLAASEADLKAGRIGRGTAAELMRAIRSCGGCTRSELVKESRSRRA